MKLRYLLKKSLNIKTTYLLLVIIALIIVVGGYFSYALFTTSSESKGALNIVTGNLYSLIESDDLDSNKSIVLTSGQDKTIMIDLKNVNGVSSKHNLYYEVSSNNVKIGYMDDEDIPPTSAGYVLGRSGTDDDTKNIKVRITNKDSNNITVTFGSDAGLPNAELTFPEGKKTLSKYTPDYDPQKLLERNPNIIAVYRYNQEGTGAGLAYTGCLGGEEAGCTDIINEVTATTEYNAGDIIKYQVNDTEIKYFNVLYDNDKDSDPNNDGTLILQQRENTLHAVAWNANEHADRSEGPQTIIPALEEITAGWTNVNDMSYKVGKTTFATGEFATANLTCYAGYQVTYNPESCVSSYRNFDRKNVKARLITAQEASEMGCISDDNRYGAVNSCKYFMNNYMYDSTRYNGTVDVDYDGYTGEYDHNTTYWTMNITPEDQSYNSAHVIESKGDICGNSIGSELTGARAVVYINKNNRVEID